MGQRSVKRQDEKAQPCNRKQNPETKWKNLENMTKDANLKEIRVQMKFVVRKWS